MISNALNGFIFPMFFFPMQELTHSKKKYLTFLFYERTTVRIDKHKKQILCEP